MNAFAMFLVLILVPNAAAHHDSIETTVTAEKDSSVSSSTTTSYVGYRTGPHTIAHFTLVCSIRWEWDRCYPLTAPKDYKAKIGYKTKEVSITSQPVGHPELAVTFKNRATKIEYEEEK